MTRIFLLVDDDLDDADLFREALAEIDPAITCYTNHNARDAIAKIRSGAYIEPDIIFIDINMPVMDGWQCLEELKLDEKLNRFPVVIYSTSSYPGDAEKALDLGALCFITKPSDYILLKDILRAISENTGDDIIRAISRFNGIATKKLFD